MKSNKERAQKRERSAAKELGGRSVIGSGALWFDKGDIKTEKFLIEDKFTDSDSYSIKLSILNTIEKQASKVHKVPLLRFGFEKYQLNYIMFHIGYFNEKLDPYSGLVPRLETVGAKSISLPFNYFEKLDLFTEVEYGIFCFIIFQDENQTNDIPFGIMSWESFKKYQDKFIA